MNYFDEQDRYFAMDELNRLMHADTEVHTDDDLGWPEGVVAALEEHAFPDRPEGSFADI
jgi:hypothetical protein